MLIDGGASLPNGFHIWLNNGQLAVNVPGFNVQASGRIDDSQWHFIAVNRNRATGRVEAYVDGNGVIGVLGTANLSLTSVPDLWIGKSRNNTMTPLRATLDHLQIYPVVLSQNSVQALLNRTNQSYCVASGLGAGGANIQWGKITLRQPDTRGGQLTAGGGLTLFVDGVPPMATITSVTNNKVIGPDQVIGGTASDVGAGVGKVEVSVNNGPGKQPTA